MSLFGFGSELDRIRETLGKARRDLADAAGRFDRQIAKKASRKAAREPRSGSSVGRPSTMASGRPVPHPTLLPQRLRNVTPPTVLDRERRLEAQRRGSCLPIAAALQSGVNRVAVTLRDRLLALRGLGGVGPRFTPRSR